MIIWDSGTEDVIMGLETCEHLLNSRTEVVQGKKLCTFDDFTDEKGKQIISMKFEEDKLEFICKAIKEKFGMEA